MSVVGSVDWLLAEFARSTPGIVHGVVVSGDGLLLAATPEVGDALGDQLAAAVSGLVSLAGGVATLLSAGPASQTILELAGGYLFVTAMTAGAALAVFADRRCDMGMIGYEMTKLAARAGRALTPAPRSAAGG